jgi:hypothetical protein
MFEYGEIQEKSIKLSKKIYINKQLIEKILKNSGINQNILTLEKPKIWIMQSQKIILADGNSLFLKLGINDDWTDSSSIKSQVTATKLIKSLGITQPEIISFSDNKKTYGYLFILSEPQKGEKLYHYYNDSSKCEKEMIYNALAISYSKIHSIKNNWSGLWSEGDSSVKKYSIHPSEFYFKAELINGSGKYLFENNIIEKKLLDKICAIWERNLNYLINRPSTLVHISPFPWSIYLTKSKEKMFEVSGFNAVGDFMWWDYMSDVAHILYPPFLDISDNERKSFINNYNLKIDDLSLNLYILLNRICAMAGCYFAPVNIDYSNKWIEKERLTLKNIIKKFM